MRNLRNPQLERGEVRIEDIKLNHKCRDDMPTLLSGLQYLYSQEASRDRLFALLDEFILPGINKKVGRPGMDMWSILVMGVVKQGLGCDFDRLHELGNEHKTLRKFLGHPAISDKLYQYQTLVDNVSLLNPELLGKVNHLIVESGHTVVGKKPGEPLRGRCDSFVVETNVHYPTDVSLLWDAMRCMYRHAGPLGSKHKVPGWRQWQHLQNTLEKKFNKIRKTRRASRKDIKAYLKLCAELIGRVKALLLELAAKGVSPQKINKITNFVMHAVRQIDQIDRRLLKGETIPQNEKVFSIFEPHTRWISKGKAGRPVELGVPVGIAEDQYQFILHYEIMWTGSDVDFAVPLVESRRNCFLISALRVLIAASTAPRTAPALMKCLLTTSCPRRAASARLIGNANKVKPSLLCAVSTPLWSQPSTILNTVASTVFGRKVGRDLPEVLLWLSLP